MSHRGWLEEMYGDSKIIRRIDPPPIGSVQAFKQDSPTLYQNYFPPQDIFEVKSMTPEDDPSWPTCKLHIQVSWCDERANDLRQGADADSISAGMRYCVPVVPGYKVWAEVSIGNELMPGSAMMFLVKSVPYSQDEELLDLGMWNEGEGRISIADVIQDWMRSQEVSEHCTNSAHGTSEQLQLSTQPRYSPEDPFWKANRWSILMNSMCLPCWQRYQRVAAVASDYGLQPVAAVLGTSPSGTMNKLKARYK